MPKVNISNAVFESVFQPILINQGDAINLKNALIDTYIQNSAEEIFIPKDLTISMSFCINEADFYIDFPTSTTKKQFYTKCGRS